jgi:disulfide oxidoreductase YuzD
MADRKLIAKWVGLFSISFPSFEIKEGLIELYCKMLADIPDDILNISAQKCLAECKFFPTIADIRDQSKLILNKKIGIKTPAEAWEEVVDAVKDGGNYSPHEWSLDIVERAMKAVGGMYFICAECNPEITRAQFMKIYESLMHRKIEDENMLPSEKKYLGIEDENVKQLVGEVANKLKVEVPA